MGAPFNGSDNTASKSVIAASGFDTAMVRLAVLPPLSEYWRWRAIALTKIKSLIRVLCFLALKQGSNSMPLDTIWFIGVVSAFVVLGLTLYVAEHRTRKLST